MTIDEKAKIQERLNNASKLEQEIDEAKNLQGRLTASGEFDVVIKEGQSGNTLGNFGRIQLLAAVKARVAALQAEWNAL